MGIVNARTGEVMELDEMSDEQLVLELKELEDVYQVAKDAREYAKFILQQRMEKEGAKLKLTPVAKVRLHSAVKIRDRKLVDKLFENCPEALRDKCFKHDLRPLKSGLNELAKLGDEWKARVDSIYQETYSLKIEWLAPEQPEEPEKSDVDMTADIPF
jgi:hypothetical protein